MTRPPLSLFAEKTCVSSSHIQSYSSSVSHALLTRFRFRFRKQPTDTRTAQRSRVNHPSCTAPSLLLSRGCIITPKQRARLTNSLPRRLAYDTALRCVSAGAAGAHGRLTGEGVQLGHVRDHPHEVAAREREHDGCADRPAWAWLGWVGGERAEETYVWCGPFGTKR